VRARITLHRNKLFITSNDLKYTFASIYIDVVYWYSNTYVYIMCLYKTIRYSPTGNWNVDKFEYYRRLAIYIIVPQAQKQTEMNDGTIEMDKIQFNTTEYLPHNAHVGIVIAYDVVILIWNLNKSPDKQSVSYFDRSFNNLYSLSINSTVSVVYPSPWRKRKYAFRFSLFLSNYIYTYIHTTYPLPSSSRHCRIPAIFIRRHQISFKFRVSPPIKRFFFSYPRHLRSLTNSITARHTAEYDLIIQYVHYN